MNDTYLKRQRHILLDMHIPDWDDRFLSKFDPASFVDLCVGSGADAVMVYCNSHVGLCYWPTKSGKSHQRLAGRDVVGEQVELLHQRDITVCAYYSGPIFNGWAYTEHPDWRIVPAGPGGMAWHGSRYGVVCPNHPDCLDFNLRQVEELASGYPFDAFFFDMVFWTSVCICESCRVRYRREESAEIPEVLDWSSPDWCRFQAARERWLTDAFRQLRDRVKASLDVPVFFNGAGIQFEWWGGLGHEITPLNDLIGGDFALEETIQIATRRTPTVTQYMTAVSAYGGGASQLMSTEEQQVHALAATAYDAEFMAIDAIAPDGSVAPATYERLRSVFGAMKPYESFLGGKPVADIGVYWSKTAAVDFRDNGRNIDDVHINAHPSPHATARRGAVVALNEAHLPITVITRADLATLDDFAVVVLPNVLRMDPEEVAAFRGYVERGGRLYSSGYTSLVTVDGTRHDDFLLADVLGCHYAGEEHAAITYLKPASADVAAWIQPVQYVPHGVADVNLPPFGTAKTTMRIVAEPDVAVLATTTLPYGDGRGTRDDHGWASIHNSPPWEDTDHPATIRRRFGAGEVVYSAADIEASPGPARDLFAGIVRSLLHGAPTFDADAHPNVRMTAFHDVGEKRMRLCFLNHPERFPALPVPGIRFHLSPPEGARFTGLHRIPSGEQVPFTVTDDGRLDAELVELRLFEMLGATYETATE